MTAALTRRALLKALVASSLTLPGTGQTRPVIDNNPFTLGVASGSPEHDSVVLWTRLYGSAFAADHEQAGASQPTHVVQWEIALDAQFSTVIRSGSVVALSALGYSVHAEPTGLVPDQWYFYRFRIQGYLSPVGRTRTLPAPSAMPERLRIAYCSCQNYEHGYFSAYREMLKDAPDLVLFLGDYIYEYAGGRTKQPVRPLPQGWVLSLEDYRERYAIYRRDPDLQAMHAACPWVVTWDDHEVQNNYAGLQAGSQGPAHPDFLSRRAAAYQAYYEHMPIRRSALVNGLDDLKRGAALRLYQQLHYGRLASLNVLDLRQYRSAQACNPKGRTGGALIETASCESLLDPTRSLLGEEQHQWLESQLTSAQQARWTVVGQQTVFSPWLIPQKGRLLQRNDGWDGYPMDRQRILKTVRQAGLKNLVFLGGDIHEHWIGHIKEDFSNPKSQTLGVEFCGTSIASRTSGEPSLAARLAANPHFVFADASHRGYGLAEFTNQQLTVVLKAVRDARERDSEAFVLASFKVTAGRPVIEPLSP
jgi:alkaline phosphatase D